MLFLCDSGFFVLCLRVLFKVMLVGIYVCYIGVNVFFLGGELGFG